LKSAILLHKEGLVKTAVPITVSMVPRYQFSRQKHLNFGLFWQFGQNKIGKKKKMPQPSFEPGTSKYVSYRCADHYTMKSIYIQDHPECFILLYPNATLK